MLQPLAWMVFDWQSRVSVAQRRVIDLNWSSDARATCVEKWCLDSYHVSAPRQLFPRHLLLIDIPVVLHPPPQVTTNSQQHFSPPLLLAFFPSQSGMCAHWVRCAQRGFSHYLTIREGRGLGMQTDTRSDCCAKIYDACCVLKLPGEAERSSAHQQLHVRLVVPLVSFSKLMTLKHGHVWIS